MFEAFLIGLAVAWLVFASACDFRKREIPDWISFSLIAISLSYRMFYSIFLNNASNASSFYSIIISLTAIGIPLGISFIPNYFPKLIKFKNERNIDNFYTSLICVFIFLVLMLEAWQGFFYSLFFNGGMQWLYMGLMGMGIFYLLGEGIYRMGFGGGDAKLLAALGCVLPFSQSFWQNIEILSLFFISLMILGALYSLGFSVFVAVRNKKRFFQAFKQETRKRKEIIAGAGIVFLLSLLMMYVDSIFLLLSMVILASPLILIYSKAIEETMVKSIYTSKLVPGDWLYENVRVGRNVIKPKITGLDEKELEILKNYKGKVMVKDGVPFTISFLLAFLLVLYLRHSDWSFFNYYLGLF